MPSRPLSRRLLRRLQSVGAVPRRVRVVDVEPMLASLAQPFSRKGWLFELKYDGFRLLAAREGSRARLRSRRGADATARFPEVASALEALPEGALFDGEVAALDERGKSDFQRMQGRFQLRRPGDIAAAMRIAPAHFFAFDLLALGGLDLRGVPLRERKAALREVLSGSPLVYVDHVEDDGEAFYAEAAARGLEGVVAKRADSPYSPGRGADWLKFPVRRTRAFVVVGFTAPGLGREGGLHLAAPGRGGLVYAGRVGTGFKVGTLGAARELLGARRIDRAPCRGAVPRGRGHTWVEPRVVCEVRYLEQTDEGLLRHPVFVRFRPDKAPADTTP